MKNIIKFTKEKFDAFKQKRVAKLGAIGGAVALGATQAQAITIDTTSLIADIGDVGKAGVIVVLAIVSITVVIVLLKKVF